MPDIVAKSFQCVDNDLTWIHIRWIYYKQLFTHSSLRLQLLNETAPTFFVDLKRILFDDVIMGISRITDRPTTAGRKNMSVVQLVLTIKNAGYSELVDSLQGMLEDIRAKSEPFRLHRNRRIAHRDSMLSVESADNPLPGITIKATDDIIEAIGDLLNECKLYFDKSSTLYDIIPIQGGANSLVSRLKDAAVFRKLEEENPVKWFSRAETDKYHDA